MGQSSSYNYAKFFTLLLFTFITSTSLILALTCTTNTDRNSNTCDLPNDGESTCYMSVVKRLDETTNKLTREYTYGCLKGAGSLGPLLCHTNSHTHRDPTFIKCCRNADMCNDDLPDPTVDDDPRWGIADDEPESPQTENNFASYRPIITYIAIGFTALIIICVILGCVSLTVIKCFGSTPNIRGSTCSLKPNLNLFHHLQNSSSSSASTKSYSGSDDLCHKAPIPNHNEDSFALDLTSGVGEQIFPRTMARAVGAGTNDVVGSGRFGRVFKGRYHCDDVAVKAFKTIDLDSWKREDTIFRQYLNHDNIVRFIASELSDTSEIWMYLEYCPYGSLCDYLDHNEILGPQQAVKILYSIINGLNYLHEDYAQASKLYKPSIAHRDIKSRNILMKSPESCCIADFGHALLKIDENVLDYGKYKYLQVGTIRYMAPEILNPMESLNYSQFTTFAQADLYQYGLIMWEVCNRTALDILHPAEVHKLPYDGVVPQNPGIADMIKIVCELEYRPPRFDKWVKYEPMKQMSLLMVECWRPNPKSRMETVGVKKKMRELYDEVTPPHPPTYQTSLYNHLHFSS